MSENEKTRDSFTPGRKQQSKICDTCGRTFKRISALILHKRTHTDDRPYHCVYCKIDFKTSSRYTKHLSSEHGILKDRVKIKHENRKSANKTPAPTMSRRIPNSEDSADGQNDSSSRNISTKKNTLTCSYCPSTYRSPGAFKSHMRLHKMQQYVTLNDVNDPSHKIIVDIAKLDCNDKAIKTKKRQLKISKDFKMFSQSEHITPFENNDSVLVHSKKALALEKLDKYSVSHQLLSDIYRCIRCKEIFQNTAALNCHTCKAKLQQSVKCRKCNRYFKSTDKLKQHESLHHSNSLDERVLYLCPHCKKSFSFKGSRDRHVKTIHDDSSPVSSVNRRHFRKRHVSQQFLCPFCKKGFNTKCSRDRHVKVIHQNLIKSFSLSALLNIRRGPDAGGQFTCKYCNKTFCKKYTRDRHVIIFHKDGKEKSSVFKCTQCHSIFSKEYMLCKHVMKVHWEEDNRLNRIKQTTEKITKDSSEIAVTKKVNESQSCDYKDNGDASNGQNKHILNNNDVDYDDKVGNLDICSGKKDKCQILTKTSFKNTYATTGSGKAIGKKRKTINEEILLEYRVATENFEPCQFDPSSNKMVHICKLCKTTYTKYANFIRHIKNRAFDHGMYLGLRKKPKIKMSDTDKSENTTTDQVKISLNHPGQLPPLKYRFECDVCLNKFTRRFNMLSHRQTHTKDEFKKAGAREDVYKSPDGKTIINLDDGFEAEYNAGRESSSATTKSNKQSNEDERGRLAVYLDRADDGNVNKNDDVLSGDHISITGLLAKFQQRNIVLAKETNETLNKFPHTVSSMQNDHVDNVQQNIENELPTKSCDVQEKEQTDVQNETPIINGYRVTNELNNVCSYAQNKYENASENIPLIQEEIPCTIPLVTRNISVIQMETEQEDDRNEIRTIQSQCLDVRDQVSEFVVSDNDKKVCITCGITLDNGQGIMCCKLCDKMFCISCSDIPADIYNILFSTGEWPSGVMWTCSICKHLVPKFTILLSQLADFEQIIGNRLTDMEQKLEKMGNNVCNR